MNRLCMQAAFVKSDKALELQFVQKCFSSLQIYLIYDNFALCMRP